MGQTQKVSIIPIRKMMGKEKNSVPAKNISCEKEKKIM